MAVLLYGYCKLTDFGLNKSIVRLIEDNSEHKFTSLNRLLLIILEKILISMVLPFLIWVSAANHGRVSSLSKPTRQGAPKVAAADDSHLPSGVARCIISLQQFTFTPLSSPHQFVRPGGVGDG